jgi:hypothetical protein
MKTLLSLLCLIPAISFATETESDRLLNSLVLNPVIETREYKQINVHCEYTFVGVTYLVKLDDKTFTVDSSPFSNKLPKDTILVIDRDACIFVYTGVTLKQRGSESL